MAISILHAKTNLIPDGADTSVVRPSDWNATHIISGLGGAAELDVGTGSNQVAAGDHTHTQYLTTAAQSDHTHSGYATQDELSVKVDKTGFGTDANGDYLTTLTYDETTRTVTVSPTDSSFDVFVNGVKYIKTSESIQHADTQGGHFVYYNESGVLTYATSPWNLLLHAPVAYVFWDATNNRGICFNERHHAGRDLYWHRNQHSAEGTKIISGFEITGYTLSDGTTDTAVTYAIAGGRVEDEDIRVDTVALADNGPYTILYRDGVGGSWVIDRSQSRPFMDDGARIKYNLNTAGTWSLANVTEDYYLNYWVFAVTSIPASDYTPIPGANPQIIIVPGQAIHSVEGTAHSEQVSTLDWGNVPFQEIAPLYQITLRYNASNPQPYANTAKCAITRVAKLRGVNSLITDTYQADHGGLGGLADDDHSQYALADGTRGAFAPPAATSYVDSTDNRLAPQQFIQVAKNAPTIAGEWYSTVKEACDYVTASGAPASGNRWVILVHPGEYTESPFTIPQYTYVTGTEDWGGAHIITNDLTVDFINLSANAGIMRFRVTGPTTAGKFAVGVMTTDATSKTAKAYWINLVQGDYGFYANGTSTGTARMHCIGCVTDTGTAPTHMFHAEGRSNIMMMECGPMLGTWTGKIGAYASGANASLTMDLCMFRTSGGTSLYVDNGASAKGISVTFAQGSIAMHQGSNGGTLTMHGSNIKTGGYTTDINIAGSSGSITFSGALTKSKVVRTGTTIPILVFADAAATTPGQYIFGELLLGDIDAQTPVTSWIDSRKETGVISGGAVTRSTGLNVSVALGSGFFNTVNGQVVVSWGGTALALPADTDEVYVTVSNTGVVSYSTTYPDETQVVTLAVAATNATDVMFLTSQQLTLPFFGHEVSDWLGHAAGPINSSGSVITKNGTNGLRLDVTDGVYFLRAAEFDVVGGTQITFTYWRQSAPGVWTQTAGQNTIDVTNYDSGTGLVALTAGKHRRDLVFVSQNDSGTEYHVVYGQGEYTAAADARNPATLPDILREHACRLAAVIVEQGATEIESIVDQRPRIGQLASDQLEERYNILAAGGVTAGSTGVVQFSNGSGVSFGLSTNSAGNTITASVGSGATATGNLGAIAGSNTTFTSGTVQITGSNAVTVRSNTNGLVIDAPTQTVQAQSITLAGNTAGNSTVTGTNLYLQAGNNITLSGTGNTVVVSAGNAAGGQFSGGVSNLGNSAGSTGITGTNLVFVGSDNVTLSQSTNANGATISFIGGAGAAGNTGYVQAGTTSMSLGTVSLANSNGISFGLNAGTLTATVKTDYLTTAAATDHSHGNPTLNLTNLTGTTASASNGFTLSLSANPAQTVQPGVDQIAAGTRTATTGQVLFGNANNVTFGFDAATTQVTASIPAGATATGNFGAIGASTQTATSGTVIFSAANNVTFGLNNNTVTASIPSGATATGNVGSIVGSNATYTSGAVTFSGSNAVTVRSTTGQAIIIDAPIQSVQTQGSVQINGSTGALSLNVGSSLSASSNGSSITFGLASNITTALQSAGAYLTTAARSDQVVNSVNGSTGQMSFVVGSSLSASSNASTITLGLASNITTALQSAGAYLTTAANSTHSHGNPTLNLTNITGTTASASNGLTLSLSGVAAQTTQTQPAGNIAGVGTTFAGANLSASMTFNSNGLNLSMSAAAPGGNIVLAGSNGALTNTSFQFGNLNGLSFYTSNGSIVGSYTDAGAGGGISGIALSAGTTNTGLSNLSFGNSNGVSFGLNGSTVTASVNAGGGTVSGYIAPALDREYLAAQIGQASMFIQPMNLREAVAFQNIVQPMNYSNASNSSFSFTASFLAGIYTRNGNSLSLLTSNSVSVNVTNSGTVGSYSIYGGLRHIPIPMTTTLSAGNYWLGLLSRTTTGGGAGMSMSNFVASQINTALSGMWGSSTNTSNQFALGLGSYATSTTAIPDSVAFSQINGSAAVNARPVVYQLGFSTT